MHMCANLSKTTSDIYWYALSTNMLDSSTPLLHTYCSSAFLLTLDDRMSFCASSGPSQCTSFRWQSKFWAPLSQATYISANCVLWSISWNRAMLLVIVLLYTCGFKNLTWKAWQIYFIGSSLMSLGTLSLTTCYWFLCLWSCTLALAAIRSIFGRKLKQSNDHVMFLCWQQLWHWHYLKIKQRTF